MARMKIEELEYRLRNADQDMCVLIVEGETDLRFWSLLAPTVQRNRTEIYPINALEVPSETNSNKERALTLAKRLVSSDLADRVKFFLDADADRLLDRPCLSNVILTDFRDLETYAFDIAAVRVMLFSFDVDPDLAPDIMVSLSAPLRECGLIRLFDAVEELQLPFKRSWGDKLSRQISGSSARPEIRRSFLLRTLLQNANLSLKRLEWAESQVVAATEKWKNLSTLEIIHGKDLVSMVSWRFTVSYEEAQRAVLAGLAAVSERISQYPQLRSAKEFALLA